MKNIITLISALLVSAVFSTLAIAEVAPDQANSEGLIAECSKKADAQQPQDKDAFVNECMNEKLGYEKEE